MSHAVPSKDLIELQKARDLGLEDEVLLSFSLGSMDDFHASMVRMEANQEGSNATTSTCLFVSSLRDYIQVIVASRIFPDLTNERMEQGRVQNDTPCKPASSELLTRMSSRMFEDGVITIASVDQEIVKEFRSRFGVGVGPVDFFEISRRHQKNHSVRVIDDLIGYVFCKYDSVNLDESTATTITLEGAKNIGVSIIDYECLDLSGLKKIDREIFAALMSHKRGGSYVYANGIDSLDAESAEHLSLIHGLELRGLKSLNASTAVALMRGRVSWIWLDSLKRIDYLTAKAIFRGGLESEYHIHLPGLVKLTIPVARAISESGCNLNIYLDGVKNLTRKVAVLIGSSEIFLGLNVEALSDEVAEALRQSLAKISLPRLKSVSATAARHLQASPNIYHNLDFESIFNRESWRDQYEDGFESPELFKEIAEICNIDTDVISGKQYQFERDVRYAIREKGKTVFSLEVLRENCESCEVVKLSHFYFFVPDDGVWEISGPYGSLEEALAGGDFQCFEMDEFEGSEPKIELNQTMLESDFERLIIGRFIHKDVPYELNINK